MVPPQLMHRLLLQREPNKALLDGGKLFSLGINAANNQTHIALVNVRGALCAIMDDTTFICPFQTALDLFDPHAEALQNLGLSIHRKKCKIYLPPSIRIPENIAQCEALRITIGTATSTTGITTYGVKVGGIPFGNENYILSYLDSQEDTITRKINVMCTS